MTNRTPPEEPMETGPSEADVVHLLGTYADALEGNALEGNASEGNALAAQDADAAEPNESTEQRRWSKATARPEGKVAMDPIFEEDPELVVMPAVEKKAGRGRMLVGALAVVGAAVVGGFLLTNEDATELDVAEAVEEEAVEKEPTEEVAADTAEDQSEPVEEPMDEAFDGAADSVGAFGHGPGQVTYADGEFVSIGTGPEGVVVARSANGTDWSTTTVDGFPKNANAYMLAQTDSGWATIVEVYPEFDESEAEASFFFDGGDPERWLATSTDLVDWTTTELPDLELDESESAWVSGIAGVGDRIAIAMQVQPNGSDEFRILLEEGILEESDLESYCGTEFEEGDAIVGYTCDFEEAMMTELPGGEVVEDGDTSTPTTTIPEEAFEEQREELFRLVPGDPGYDEIAGIYTSDFGDEMPPSVVISGPLDGPFEISTLPVGGYNSSILASGDGFVAVVSGGEAGTVLKSPDGVTWTATGELDGANGFQSITAAGNRLLGVSNSSDSETSSIEAWVSDDSGATWTSSTIDTELFGAYGMPVGGPAGFAVLLDGSLEPFEDPFSDIGELNIVKDGFTMLMDLSSDDASLLGPDGEIVHDTVSMEQIFMTGIENVARLEGFNGDIAWLDPETGEELVSIGESDFNAAFEEASGTPIDSVGSDFEEQARSGELWFSKDGQTWTLIEQLDSNGENGFTSLAAVGDDEIIVRSETYNEPPQELLAFEEEGREPTEEEVEALDSFFENEQQDSSTWRSIPVG